MTELLSFRDLTIDRKAKLVIAIFSLLTALAIAVSFLQGNQIRLGGPIDLARRQQADLVADILPPPLYVIEPWLEVSQLQGGIGKQAEHVARLQALHRDHAARRQVWQQTALAPELKEQLDESLRLSDQFWTELEQQYLPALRNADRSASDPSFASLAVSYARHRAAIDRLVETTNARQVEIDAQAQRTELQSLIVLLAMAVLLLGGILALGQFLLRKALYPLNAVADAIGSGLERLAGGDLLHRIPGPFPPEHEHLRRRFNQTGESLDRLLGSLADTASNVDVASAQIRAASHDLSQRSEISANTLNATVQTMDEVTALVDNTKDSVMKVNAAMQQALQEACEGQRIVHAAMEAMQAIEHSSAPIAKFTQLIDGIAFQTNLLALNAGVEAARAGDAGKGFAVVASEVRALAQRAAATAKDIGELVSESNAQVRRGVADVSSTEARFNSIVEQVQSIGAMLADAAESSNNQALVITQLGESITEMDRSTQQNAAMAEECSAAAGSLAGQSQALNSVLAAFQATGLRPTGPLPPAATSDDPVVIKLPPLRAPAARPARPAVQGNTALAASPDDWSEF